MFDLVTFLHRKHEPNTEIDTFSALGESVLYLESLSFENSANHSPKENIPNDRFSDNADLNLRTIDDHNLSFYRLILCSTPSSTNMVLSSSQTKN